MRSKICTQNLISIHQAVHKNILRSDRLTITDRQTDRRTNSAFPYYVAIYLLRVHNERKVLVRNENVLTFYDPLDHIMTTMEFTFHISRTESFPFQQTPLKMYALDLPLFTNLLLPSISFIRLFTSFFIHTTFPFMFNVWNIHSFYSIRRPLVDKFHHSKLQD